MTPGSRVLLADDAFLPMLPALHAAFPGLATVIYAGDGAVPDGTLGYEDLIAAAALGRPGTPDSLSREAG